MGRWLDLFGYWNCCNPFRVCVKQCEETGCVGQSCFPYCKLSKDGEAVEGSVWYMKEPLYMRWKQLDCQSDCRYHCMVEREKERESLGQGPLKYHGKWPFVRVYGIQVWFFILFALAVIILWDNFILIHMGMCNFDFEMPLLIQEPASVVFSLLNLAMHFHGWLSFFSLLNYKLPLRREKRVYYDFSGLWHIYALLSINSWFWSAVFHSRLVFLYFYLLQLKLNNLLTFLTLSLLFLLFYLTCWRIKSLLSVICTNMQPMIQSMLNIFS